MNMKQNNASTTDMPIAERLFQMFQQNLKSIFDAMDKGIQSFKWSDNPDLTIDNRVFYPMDFTLYFARHVFGPRLLSSDTMEGDMPALLHLFGNYRRTKTIYTIDQTLFQHLVDAKWPSGIPMEAAALPKNGCVLDLPPHEIFGIGNFQIMDWVQIFCTYDMNHEKGGLDIVLMPIGFSIDGNGRWKLALSKEMTIFINMGAQNLEEAILDYSISLRNEMNYEMEKKIISQDWVRYLKTILSVLLYINGNDDLLELVPPRAERPMNKAKRRRLAKQQTGLPQGLSHPPTRFLVGSKFASIIQRWEERERAESIGSGRSSRPHLRAAHAHLYRIGKGRTGQKVRFLPPIPVKGWEAPEEEPTSRLVK